MIRKMKKPKTISHPVLKSACRLTPLQLNEMRCNVKHTVLTPELLEKIAAASANKGEKP